MAVIAILVFEQVGKEKRMEVENISLIKVGTSTLTAGCPEPGLFYSIACISVKRTDMYPNK